MDSELIQVLGDVGFTGKEARVYVALLTLNSGTVQQVAKLSDLKRPIIYVVLEGLIKRGYASELPDKKTRAFQAVPASIVLKRLQSNVAHFSQYLPIFKTLGNRGGPKPKITYLDTKEGIQNMYEEINYDPTPFFITSYVRLEAHFPGIVDRWVKNYKKGLYKKMRGRHVISDDERELLYTRDFIAIDQKVRASPVLRGLKVDISIYGDKLAISNLGEQLFAVVIESTDITDSMRSVFEVLWAEAKEVKG